MSSNVAMVAQRPFIFSGTVRDNLLYSCEALNTQGGHCEAGESVTLDRLIETVQQVGLFLDVLRFGLQQTMEPSAHPDIEGRLLKARRTLYERHGQELERDVEFFRADAFLEYGSLAMNIVFGAPVDKAYSIERLHQNREFFDFLARAGFWERGLDLAAEIAARTLDIFRSVGAGQEMFENTPMQADDLEAYAGILDRLRSRRPAGLTRGDQKKLIKLALRFNPGRHTLARLDKRDKKSILKARAAFKEHMEARHPGAINFYGRGDYLHTQSIQENILHGLVRTDRAGAEERVSRRIMRILIEENVLEQVLEIGFRFDVGSQGDRLSGGQRQKIALARALLKDSPIVILDEATSSLDNASQARIQNIIHSNWGGRSTVISVVHRLDPLKNYDLVAVLKYGRLEEIGTYGELIVNKGALYDLVHGSR